MATKLNAGYWNEDYFPDGYWEALYWPGYGYVEPVANFIAMARHFAFTTDVKIFSWTTESKIYAITSKIKTIAFTTLKRIYNFIAKEIP